MKGAILVSAMLALAFAIPAFAVEGGQPAKAPEVSFEQRKADMLDHIDRRITRLQDEKACIQAAKDRDELKLCWDKFRAEEEKDRARMREKHSLSGQGGKRGPRGPRNQTAPGGQGGQAPPPPPQQ